MMRKRKPLDYYLSLKYPVLLVAEPEGGYTALHPDLEGCVSVGETREEALANLEEARRLWLETAYEHGDEIPLPSTEREYSGRVLVRMPKSLHRRLDKEARAEGVSLNQYIVSLLAERSSLRALKRELWRIYEGAETISAEPHLSQEWGSSSGGREWTGSSPRAGQVAKNPLWALRVGICLKERTATSTSANL
jgi:predicted RNase H-like HicB family nuclease